MAEDQSRSIARGRVRTNLTLRRRIVYSLVICSVFYAFSELVTSALYTCGVIDQPGGAWFEIIEKKDTLQFDPIRGYKLTQTTARFAHIIHGFVEYVSVFRGNAHGFPDRDDFTPTRGSPRSKRFAVFGDSFTAAQYLRTNWPDFLEDLTANEDHPLELLNFSVDGGGLANWWSILTRFIEPESYELDGVIFAVYGTDLRRTFSVAEHRGFNRSMFGRVGTWDPALFPKTREEATRYLKPTIGELVSPEQFDLALRLKRPPGLRPYLLHNWYPFRAR